MNLKLKRLVRTTSSEEYALFDLDQVTAENVPMTIGKLDLHYTGEGVYGTILLWDDASRRMTPAQRGAFLRALLGEVTQPMGVPNEYVVEFFAPTLADWQQLLLADPQTSGGLLVAFAPSRLEGALAAFREAGVPAAVVGRMVAGPGSATTGPATSAAATGAGAGAGAETWTETATATAPRIVVFAG